MKKSIDKQLDSKKMSQKDFKGFTEEDEHLYFFPVYSIDKLI